MKRFGSKSVVSLVIVGVLCSGVSIYWRLFRQPVPTPAIIQVVEPEDSTDEMWKASPIRIHVRSDGLAFAFENAEMDPTIVDFADIVERVVAGGWREVVFLPDDRTVGRAFAIDFARFLEESGHAPPGPANYRIWVLHLPGSGSFNLYLY